MTVQTQRVSAKIQNPVSSVTFFLQILLDFKRGHATGAGTRYFDYHHTADDTLAAIDPEQLRQNIAAYAVFAYLAAEEDWTFGPQQAPPAASH